MFTIVFALGQNFKTLYPEIAANFVPEIAHELGGLAYKYLADQLETQKSIGSTTLVVLAV